MKATFQLTNPDEMQASMTITMTIKQWKELRQQLDVKWPSVRLSTLIGSVIRAAEDTFSDETKEVA